MSLASSITSKLAASVAAAQAKADTELAVAQAWDAAGFTAAEPFVIYTHGIYGDKGGLGFREVGPDQLAALMRAFPALPCVQYSHGGTKFFHPEGAREIPEGVGVDYFDGFEVRLAAGRAPEVQWSAIVGDRQISLSADLRPVHWLYPRVSRRIVGRDRYGAPCRYEGRAELHWPEGYKPGGAWTLVHYAQEPTNAGEVRLRGSDLVGLAASWEAEANRRGAETRAAFEAAYDTLPGFPEDSAITAQAEALRAAYSATAFRVGTLEQTAALETPAALAYRTVAEKHWPEYAAHHGIEAKQPCFDHYAWACDMLKRCGLYEANGYRYGSAWL